MPAPRRLTIGILELLRHPAVSPAMAADAIFSRRLQVAVTPQAVAVWCRQLGHDVHYATYYGLGDPRAKLPADLDILFISSHTYNSSLAYALSLLYRRQGTTTVIGGPHSRSFPADCLRYFDIAVVECDRELVADILAGRFAPGSAVTSLKAYDDPPTVAERLPELAKSTFDPRRGRGLVPMLASVGCPYRCDFCIDWDAPYRPIDLDRLREDVDFLSRYPGVALHFQDPNFAVRFNEVMDVLERVPPDRRRPYYAASAISNLRPERLQRLQATRCQRVCQGVESWSAYSDKAHVADAVGAAKLEQLNAHFHTIGRYVPYVQAAFILGLDGDADSEPFDLTRAFIRANPGTWTFVNVPVPYGGTPLHDNLRATGRLLSGMPLACYCQPFLTHELQNYDALSFYESFLRVHETASSLPLLAHRLTAAHTNYGRRMLAFQTAHSRGLAPVLRRLIAGLKTDANLRAFHAGADVPLPANYADLYRRRLGPFAELMPVSDSRPVLDPVPLAGRRAVELAPAPIRLR